MLRSLALLSALSSSSVLAIPEILILRTEELQEYAPFVPPFAQAGPALLFKRGACPSGYNSCSSINEPGACCSSGTNCALDQSGHVACCPVNNYCTGVVGSTPSGSVTSGGTSQTSGTITGFVSTVTVTSTAGVTGGTQITQTVPASITGTIAGGGSTVPNAYYPFVSIPTSFGNSAICSQYYTSCQEASTSCYQSLAGVNGVTIGGMASGTTQFGSSGIALTSASSICSSLSLRACLGLQSTQCSQFGSTGATGSGFIQSGRGPRETGCPGMLYVAAAGFAVGAMGIAI